MTEKPYFSYQGRMAYMTPLEKRGRGLKQLMVREEARVSLLPSAALLRSRTYLDEDIPIVSILRTPIPKEAFPER